MKKFNYEATVTQEGNQHLIINNLDKIEPNKTCIRTMKLYTFNPGSKSERHHISLKIDNETHEIKSTFEAVPGARRQIKGAEYIYNQPLEAINQFIAVIQEVDPLPLDALEKIEQHTQIKLGDIFWSRKITQLLSENRHDEALEIALALDLQGEGSIAYLLNLYTEMGDEKHYYQILKRVPETSDAYQSARERLHEHLVSIASPKDELEKIATIEEKFRLAMQAGLERESASYFAELCGESGLNPTIKGLTGNPEPFIQIAQNQRQLKKEIEELRDYKARSEASRAATNRQSDQKLFSSSTSSSKAAQLSSSDDNTPEPPVPPTR